MGLEGRCRAGSITAIFLLSSFNSLNNPTVKMAAISDISLLSEIEHDACKIRNETAGLTRKCQGKTSQFADI